MLIVYIIYATLAKFYNLERNGLFLIEIIHTYYTNKQKMWRSNKNKIKNIYNPQGSTIVTF